MCQTLQCIFLAKAPQMGIRKMAITPVRTVAHRWDWSQIKSEIEDNNLKKKLDIGNDRNIHFSSFEI